MTPSTSEAISSPNSDWTSCSEALVGALAAIEETLGRGWLLLGVEEALEQGSVA